MNGGALKTGINLDTPIKGGTVGLMTNALGTDAMVSFDSISVGPLEVRFMLNDVTKVKYFVAVTIYYCQRLFRPWYVCSYLCFLYSNTFM